MSETEYHKGKLRRVLRLDGETLEEQCKRIADSNNYKFDQRFHKNWKECILDEGYRQFVAAGDVLFEIYDHIKYDELPFVVEENPDGTYSFYGSFYNGGACLSEMIEEGLL